MHIALKSYCQPSARCAMIGPIEPSPMKLLRSSLFQTVLLVAVLLASPVEGTVAQTGSGQSSDSSWPREKYSNGTRLIIYQPQIDDWKNFQDLSWRMAISLTPKGGKTVVGVVEMKGTTNIDNVSKLVTITNPEITGTYFPSLDQRYQGKDGSNVQNICSVNLLNLFAFSDRVHAKEGGTGRRAIEQRPAEDFRGLPAIDPVEREW